MGRCNVKTIWTRQWYIFLTWWLYITIKICKSSISKSFTQLEDESIVNTCFNILKSVSIPKGVVITDRNTSDYTQYTAFINLNEAAYYFNTYNNGDIIKASINDADSLEIKSLGKLKQKPNFPLLKNYK